jgi:hypothetical protein
LDINPNKSDQGIHLIIGQKQQSNEHLDAKSQHHGVLQTLNQEALDIFSKFLIQRGQLENIL